MDGLAITISKIDRVRLAEITYGKIEDNSPLKT
jgi:hypothetical protein